MAGNAILILLIFATGGSSLHPASNISHPKTHITSPTPTISPSPTPLPSPTPTNTPIPTPTLSPTPTPEPKPTSQPTEMPTNPPVNDTAQTLLNQINSFRAGKGLAPFASNGYACSFAVARAGEIVGNFNHDGFKNRINAKTLPYPSYMSVAENIAMNSDSNAVVQAWIDSPGHNENMSKDIPYACIGISGNYYVLEEWKP